MAPMLKMIVWGRKNLQFPPPIMALLLNKSMKTKSKQDLQAEAQYTKFLIDEIGLPKLFPFFTNTAILARLQQRGLHQFLLNISSYQLRKALEKREQLQDEMARNRNQNRMKYNVLDFTVQQLIKHCRSEGVIGLHQYQNYRSTNTNLRDHHHLGMLLVGMHPEKYEVGKMSHHFNRARKIQQLYGIKRTRSEWDYGEDQVFGDVEQQEQWESQPQFEEEQQEEGEEEDEGENQQPKQEQRGSEDDSYENQLINDQVEQSDYDIPEQDEKRRAQQKNRGATKRKLIRKRDKSKLRNLRTRTKSPQDDDSDEEIKPREEIYFEQQDSEKLKQKPKKKNTIDSDQQR